MQDRPTALELLAAVRSFLEDDLVTVLEGRRRFHALVAANVLGIVERELAGEAMLQDIEERQVCPVCHHKITPDYLVCPNCHTKLHKKCDHCGRVLNLKWSVCPYCGETQGAPLVGRTITTPPPPPPARLPRREPASLPESIAPQALPPGTQPAEGQS